jgi:hypothetical protein
MPKHTKAAPHWTSETGKAASRKPYTPVQLKGALYARSGEASGRYRRKRIPTASYVWVPTSPRRRCSWTCS